MALSTVYSPVITNDLGTGLGVYGVMTPYNSALQNNGANQPLGSISFVEAPSQNTNTLSSTAGYGAGLWVKYVLYKSTTNPAVKTGPAPVWWTDETFTTVSGSITDAYGSGTNGFSCAGWLLPNAGTVTGIGAGTTAFTATTLNNGSNGSFVYIGLSGFIPSAYLSAGAIDNLVYGTSTNWAVAAATSTFAVEKYIAWVYGTVTSNIGDVMAILPVF